MVFIQSLRLLADPYLHMYKNYYGATKRQIGILMGHVIGPMQTKVIKKKIEKRLRL